MKKLKEFDIFLEKKPGPDGYMTGLSDKDEEEKEDQMKKQGAMADDDPDAYKEMPGDKKAREEGKVKKSKFTTAYHKKFKKNEMKNLQELDSFITDLKATKEAQRIEDIKNTKLNTKLKTIDEFLSEGVMSDLHLIAGEVKDEDAFVKTFFSDYGDKIKKSKDSEEWVRSLYRDTVNEEYIGPFVFNDKMSDEELKDMYGAALDGYANYSRGFQHPKSKYKQAYQEIEKILKKRGVSVDEAVELVHVYKDGELYGTGELVKGKDKKIKGKAHQLIRFDGSTEDYYPAEDIKLVESINEDYDKMLDRRYGRSRDYNDIEVKDMHFQTDADELEKMKLAYGYRLGGMTSREKIEDAEYALRRYRKTIKYGNGKEVGVFLPGSYDAATSTLGDGPHKSARPKVKWNQRKYDQWIEDVASNDGWKHAADMAQNANNEPGLIDWVKRNNRGDDPLQRIQWDIEAMSESVDMYYLDNAKDSLQPKNVYQHLGVEYGQTRRGDKYVQINYIPVSRPQSQQPEWVKVFYDNDKDLNKIGKELDMDLKESVVTEGVLSNVRKAIAKTQGALKKKWAKKGGYENFGQDEIRDLQDKYDYSGMVYGTPEEREAAKLIDALDQWAMNYVGESEVTEGTYDSKDHIGSTSDGQGSNAEIYKKGRGYYVVVSGEQDYDFVAKNDKELINKLEEYEFDSSDILESVNEKKELDIKEVTYRDRYFVLVWHSGSKTWEDEEGHLTIEVDNLGKAKKIAKDRYEDDTDNSWGVWDNKLNKIVFTIGNAHEDRSFIKLKESVNEKKELPKEITKHKDIPSWARYVAQHSDGEWTWYEETPTMIKFKSGGGAWKQDGNQTYTGVKTDGKDWDKMPTYYYVKNGKVTESTDEKEQTNMRNLQTLESFINEKKDQTNDQSPLSDDGMETGIKNKAKESGVPVGLLRIIMKRGLAAWKSGHRPGATQAQWGYARVNSFLTKQDGTWGGADSDIAKKVRDGGHDKKL